LNSKTAILASPMLCLTVLTVIAADNARHVKPDDARPYHQNAKTAIDAFPWVIGYWTGSDEPVPEAAVKLLKPNALLSRRYTNHPTDGRGAQWANLLITQCADSRDMTGHYPPSCYPNNGEPPSADRRPFHLFVGGIWIDGFEYQFKARRGQGCVTKSVYNFFIVPGRGIVPDITGVRAAAIDYQRRYFGAAQFQVVMDADQPIDVRDAVFTTLIGSDAGIIPILAAVPVTPAK
jgi:hypothetical protein